MEHAERPRPKGVQEARYHDDRAALSAMGRKGAEAAARTRALREVKKQDDLAEITREQARLLSLSSEGDVLPPDPNVIASLENGDR